MTNPHAVRAARLVHIRDLLLEKPRTAEELALLCEVSLSTIYRDLVHLQIEPLSLPLYVADGNKWVVADPRDSG
jgi:predicted DNA-binding transcriptional regulator YafY